MKNDIEAGVKMESEMQEKPQIVPSSIPERVLQALVVLVLPVACFSFIKFFLPEWQDGKFSSYVTLLLSSQTNLLFFPLLLYAVVSLLLLLASPLRFACSFAIRVGIYTGVLLAFQYTLLVLLGLPSEQSLGPAFGWGIFIVLSVGLFKGKLPLSGRTIFVIWVGMVSVIVSILLASQAGSWKADHLLADLLGSLGNGALVLVAVTLMIAPALCLWIMAGTAIRIFKEYEKPIIFSAWRGTGLAAWLLGFAAAWAFSIQEMFKMYASLPTQPPNCYIATAAARGHRPFVGSQPARLDSGILWVNAQLRYLKCAELALMALVPGLHRPLRAMYDLLGPTLARRMTHPLLADLAYLSFKPIEILARFSLRLLIPNLDEYASQLYR
jgi:hypothetical protein